MPECEFSVNDRDLLYNQPWLSNAIPTKNGKFDNCHRFAPSNATSLETLDQCTANMFDSSKIIPCSEFIYTSDEINIQTEVSKKQMINN